MKADIWVRAGPALRQKGMSKPFVHHSPVHVTISPPLIPFDFESIDVMYHKVYSEPNKIGVG